MQSFPDMPTVKPEILVWARETAGLSMDEAAQKLGLKAARGMNSPERLASIEAGNTPLKRPLLLKMSKLYRRPLLTFYMSAPPRKGDRGQDFRTLPDRESGNKSLIDALVRDVRARQFIVRSILEDEEEATPLPFVASMRLEDGEGAVLSSIRQAIRPDLVEFRSQDSPESAFALLRERVEAVGVFVLLIGDLGSHHTALEVESFRGFALADPIAPFIVINDRDAKPAWAFTLLHELVHIWLGATGVSGAFTDSRIERFCNDVASAFLLPESELPMVGVGEKADPNVVMPLVSDFARERHLSRTMVAYRLWRAGLIAEPMWTALRSGFRAEWLESRATQRERKGSGGPNYYVVRRHRLGPALLRLVARNLSGGTLTPTKASKVLGVKPRSVGPLLSGALGQAA